MTDRFYTSQRLDLGETSLSGAEAHHLSTVRRLEIGEHVVLFNGDGADYHAEILSITKKAITLIVFKVQPVQRELKFPLIVASAVPKGDRADFLVEKLTELGVTCWIPLNCQRSVVQPRDAKLEKFQRAVIEASKQCGRNRLMDIQPPVGISEFLGRQDLADRKLILHPDQPADHRGPTGAASSVVLIGPEGGFTSEEVQAAREAGWACWPLGPRILRIETACLAVAAILGQLNR